MGRGLESPQPTERQMFYTTFYVDGNSETLTRMKDVFGCEIEAFHEEGLGWMHLKFGDHSAFIDVPVNHFWVQ